MTITADMLRECRAKMQGVIIADRDDRPIVRSSIRYDEPDPLYDGSGDQIVVLKADDLAPAEQDVTDEEVADDLGLRWVDLVREARSREEQNR